MTIGRSMLSNKSNGMVTPRKVVWLAFFLSKSLYNKKQTDNNKLYTRPLWYKTLRIGYPLPLHSHLIWKGTYTNQIMYKMIQFKKSLSEDDKWHANFFFKVLSVGAPKLRKKYFRPIHFLNFSAKEVSSVNRQKR